VVTRGHLSSYRAYNLRKWGDVEWRGKKRQRLGESYIEDLSSWSTKLTNQRYLTV
jgi:hypothetical protein